MKKIIRSFWIMALLLPVLLQAAPLKKAQEVKETREVKESRDYKEDRDYRLLKSPVQTSVGPDRIEVAEVFWYGCPHCYSLDKVVNEWKPKLAKEAELIRVPGFFGPNLWQTHAQLYYTLESLFPDEKLLDSVHDAVFRQVQETNNRLSNEKEMADYLAEHYKVDKEKFRSYYNSFGVKNLLNQASSKVRGYQLTGVPALVIDGRFVIEPKVGLEKMTEIADFLIQKVSTERTEAKAKAKNAPATSHPVKDQSDKVK